MKKYTLRNGIPVLIEKMTGTNVVTALILFKVGSRHETPGTNGVSHFVEHLFFKGTTNRPTTLQITQELDGVGAAYNAFTSKDYTGYYVKVSSRHTALALDILEDILFHPLFDATEIDRERGVIVEEINMYEDNPMTISEEFSEQLLFGKHHPLGYRIAGPKENIQRISRARIVQYRDTYYHPDNMVVIVTGNTPKNILSVLQKKFSPRRHSHHRTPRQQRFVYKQTAARLQVVHKNTAQAHVALSFPAPTYTAKDLVVAQILATLLGGNMSSRLFINIRERQGLCYYIRAGVSPYEDMGAFTIQAGFDKQRIDQALQAILHELASVRADGITPEELHKAKEYMSGKMTLHLEDSEDVAAWWGRQALFQKHFRTPAEYDHQVRQVTHGQVEQLARRLFVPRQANLAIIGPFNRTQQRHFQRYLQF